MGRVGLFALLSCLALLGATASASVRDVRLSVRPASPHALDPARIDLRSSSVSGLRVLALSPRGHRLRVRMKKVGQGHASGTFRFAIPGSWQLRVTDATGRRTVGRRLGITVQQAVPTPPPEGFGPLGQPGCNPPSPRNTSPGGFADVYGTATGGEQLWALAFGPSASPDTAVFDDVLGKEVKIVFRMTAYHPPLTAVGPDGTKIMPVWGPAFHSGSNWGRPGVEWGAGFVFPEPGCWRIRVGSRGDLWFLLRS